MEQDLLQQLINETSNTHNPKSIDVEKIKKLIHKSSKMRKEEKMRADNIEQYFVTLKKRIDESSSFLEKAKKDLENINFSVERERFNENANNDDFMSKTDEEINEEMESIKAKLAALETRVKTLNDNTYGAEENFKKSIKTLQNISKGIYGGDNLEQ